MTTDAWSRKAVHREEARGAPCAARGTERPTRPERVRPAGAFPESNPAGRQPRVRPRRAAASTAHRTRHGRVARAGAAQRSARIFAPAESGGDGRERTRKIRLHILFSIETYPRKSYDSRISRALAHAVAHAMSRGDASN